MVRRMAAVHDDRKIRVSFHGRGHEVAQERLPCVFACPSGALEDHRALCFLRSSHDRLDLLHVVDIKSRNAVTAFGGMVQQLTHGDQGHRSLPMG
jgi:hypothetical protein